ncbi:MAG: preprotein translocase subunit SecG [Epsilonproteobacteria bacterium]|nr:preprotein translocase subunit SecG [Campylobacterota bacterium]
MYALLMVFFIILAFLLAGIILIQQGKGDMGLGSLSGSQMLFGASGEQNFFEKATWLMAAIFIFGSLGLAILKSKEEKSTRLKGYTVTKQKPAQTNAVEKTSEPAQAEAATESSTPEEPTDTPSSNQTP